MGKWTWEGFNKDGKLDSGVVEASTERDARRLLRDMRVRVRRLSSPSILDFDLAEWLSEKGLGSSVRTKELATFTKQLAIMIEAGIPILQVLEIIFRSERNPVLKRAARSIAMDVKEGKTLSEAMEKHPRVFDKLYVSLVKSGEMGGILDTILVKLAEQIEKVEKLKQQVKMAMAYPAVVTLVGVGVVWGLMFFVVPQFVGMLEETGQELPYVTQVVVDISGFVGRHTLLLMVSAVALFVAARQFVSTKEGKVVFDNAMMKIPLFAGIVVKGNLASFCRTFSVLLGSGVPLLAAIDICIETLTNEVIVRDLTRVRNVVEQGKNLTDPIRQIPYFPEMLGQMMKVGEQTGQLDGMLAKIADVFEDEVDSLISSLTKMLEPLVIVFLGGIVSVVLAAMYLPIFSVAGGAD